MLPNVRKEDVDFDYEKMGEDFEHYQSDPKIIRGHYLQMMEDVNYTNLPDKQQTYEEYLKDVEDPRNRMYCHASVMNETTKISPIKDPNHPIRQIYEEIKEIKNEENHNSDRNT